MSRLVIGVDPGGRHTGLVIRSGDTLHYWSLTTRDDAPFDWYLKDVVDAVIKAKDVALNLALQASLGASPNGAPTVLAVEDLNDPIPQMGITSVRGILDTAQVIGALAGHFLVTRVPPGGHGSNPLAVYPSQIVDPAEKQGRGRLRHVRAAWDIAHTARTITPVGPR